MSEFKDLTGMKSGKLTVLYRAEDRITPAGNRYRMWHCVCECKNEFDLPEHSLLTKNPTRSCGCLCNGGKKGINDLTGQRYPLRLVPVKGDEREKASGGGIAGCLFYRYNLAAMSAGRP